MLFIEIPLPYHHTAVITEFDNISAVFLEGRGDKRPLMNIYKTTLINHLQNILNSSFGV